MAGTTAIILGGLTALTAGTSIYGGMQQQDAANRQANFAQAQGILQAEEAVRQSAAQAQQESKAADAAQRRQKIAYLKSGVSLEGSPLLMMEETRLRGERNVNEITTAGGYSSAAASQEGRTRAQNYKASGRQAFMSGLSSGLGSASSFAGGFSGGSSRPSTYTSPKTGETVKWN